MIYGFVDSGFKVPELCCFKSGKSGVSSVSGCTRITGTNLGTEGRITPRRKGVQKPQGV